MKSVPFLADTAKTVFFYVITSKVSENSQFSSHRLKKALKSTLTIMLAVT